MERLSRMKINDGVILITYPDSLGGNLKGLHRCMERYFGKCFHGIHILPFFPSTGDRGFAPVRYDQVDPAFGTWEDIEALKKDWDIYCDMMVNHISTESREFKDYLMKGEKSPYREMFLDFEEFWGSDYKTSPEYQLLYRRKEADPYIQVKLGDGTVRKIWNTFRDTQVDIDVTKPVTKEYIRETIDGLLDHGISGIRLDAAGYVTKIKGTRCFCAEPQLWEFLEPLNAYFEKKGRLMFTEIHARWEMAKKLEEHGIWTYDFVLPFLVLHAMVTGEAERLVEWMKNSPRNQFTVLDTHDGIGVYDADGWVERGEAEETIRKVEGNLSYAYRELHPEKKKYWESYQLYGTYFSILEEDEKRYLCARAIQLFAPGIPMVYYEGLLAGKNDIDGLMKSSDHRDINRHNFPWEEIDEHMNRSVVKRLIKLLEFRNNCPAFQGQIQIQLKDRHSFLIERTWEDEAAVLECDLSTGDFHIRRMCRQKWEELSI